MQTILVCIDLIEYYVVAEHTKYFARTDSKQCIADDAIRK